VLPVVRTHPVLAAAAALAATAAPVGCGGAKASDTEQVTQTIRTYLEAQAGGDGQRACPQLAPTAQRQLVAVTVKLAKGLAGTGIACEQAVSLIHGAAGARVLRGLASARVADVKISGGHASADVLDGTQVPRQRVLLEKIDSTWKITEVPGLPG
jgi:hypothetical protein